MWLPKPPEGDWERSGQADWGPLKGFLAALVVYILPQLLLLIGISVVLENDVIISTDDEISLAFIQLFGAIGTFFLSAWFVRSRGLLFKKFLNINLTDLKRNLPLIFKALGLYLVISIFASVILSSLLPPEISEQQQNIGFSTEENGVALIPIAVTLILVIPFVEEVVFRGLLFRGFRNRMNFWWASTLSGGLFALAHGQINVGVDIFIMSIALAWVYEKTTSLSAPIALHALKNSIAFFLLFVVG